MVLWYNLYYRPIKPTYEFLCGVVGTRGRRIGARWDTGHVP
jgi:hypothetical protein